MIDLLGSFGRCEEVTKVETRICQYCGNTIRIESQDDRWGEDGRLYKGWSKTEGCTCELYRVKQKLKPMCYNCKYRDIDDPFHPKGYCGNEAMKKEMSDKFEITKLAIKDELQHCKHWEPMNGLFNSFIPKVMR